MNRLTNLEGDDSGFETIDDAPRKRKPGGEKMVPPAATTSDTTAIDIAPIKTAEVSLDEFSKQTNEVQALTKHINEKVLEYSQHTKNKHKEFDMRKRKEMNDTIESVSKQIDGAISSMKALLGTMKAATDKIERDNIGIIKLRENQFRYLAKQFVDCVQQYSKAQQEGQDLMQAETEQRVRQRLRAQGELASDEVVRKVAVQVMQGQQNALFLAAKDELVMVQLNAIDIHKIHDAMVGLEKLLKDFLVNEGEVLGSITSIQCDHPLITEKGMEKVVTANQNQKKSRNKFCCILLVIAVAIIFAVILSVVLGFSLPKNTL